MSSATLLLSEKFKSGSLLQNLGITFFENVLSKGLNFLVILVLTRTLGPEDYGKYSFLFVTVALCSALFDFGMENTAVRFSSRDKEKSEQIFGLYLGVKLLILLGLVLAVVFGVGWLVAWMGKSAITPFLPFLIIGLLGESLFFVNDTFLQANRNFQFRAILNIARYSIVLLYVLFLMTGAHVTLQYVMYIYLIPLIFSMVFLGRYRAFLAAYFRKGLDTRLMREIVGYEKWMFSYSIANNLLSRVDFFMLGFWVGFQDLGIYNAAFQLCAIVSFLPLVLGKVLLPTLAELKPEQIFRTSGKIIRGTTMMSLGAALLIPLSQWVVPMLLGPAYGNSVHVLQILLLAFIAGLLSMPYEQALYSLGKPEILCVCRYFQLFLIVILNVLLIPSFGIYAAAFTALLGRVLYLVFVRRFYLGFEGIQNRKQAERMGMEAT